jgi:hypothetical protein
MRLLLQQVLWEVNWGSLETLPGQINPGLASGPSLPTLDHSGVYYSTVCVAGATASPSQGVNKGRWQI